MKTRFLVFAVFVLALIPVATKSFAEESFDGYSSIDPPLSEVVAGQSSVMTIKFWYTSGPYAMNNFTPVIEVNPSSARQFVQVDVDSIEITQGQIKRIPVTLMIDPHIEHEKIFLSISYTGNHFVSGDLQKSSWNDQMALGVKGILVPEPPYFENIDEEKPCGLGTVYQDGICVVDKIENSTETSADPSKRWGGPYTFDGKSPLKQFKSGVPIDEIQCNEGLVQIFKKSDNSPACVTLQTKSKLIERGWAESSDDVVFERSAHPVPEPNPSPEPEKIPEEERLYQEKQKQAKIQTQKEIMTDYRGNQHQIDAINKYREEFESSYFLEQFVILNKQNFEKDELINFVVVQWGYQPEKCISYDVKGYFKPYENYDPFYVEKISEWEDTQECTSVITSDSNGYVIVNMNPVPGIPEEHLICNNPGEYRILVRNLDDESQVEWGYYTCQRDKLVGEPQPWMEIPE